MTYFLYNLVLLILSPLIAVFLLYRVFISGKSRKSWRQQMGSVKLPHEIEGKNKIWIHAVSVGESVASAAVVSELKQMLPGAAVVVSTTTETGQEMARKSIKDADAFFYYPFDLVSFVSRSINRVRPKVFASTDTEIWPNFRHIARKKGVKTAMINGTISDKTISGAKKIPWLYKWTMSNIDLFCMQSQADADRVIGLGADRARVTVTGNCKADQSADLLSESEQSEIWSRYKFPAGSRVFVAGSTNPGEDAPVMEAFVIARKAHPSLRLIIAPRQIERRDEIVSIARDMGLKCGWRSEPASITGDEDIVILDTFGELARVYSIADISFVGGSLVPRGCHSILQPISQGKPVFFGPYTFKAKDLVSQAKAAGVGFEIADGRHLGEQITTMLSDNVLLEDIKARCDQMMQANQGASRRTADALVRLYNYE
jgi:3-deoxy-D-manno-octulosonic-acid transferase